MRQLTRLSVLPVWAFCADLAERLERGDHVVPGLADAGAAYRADPLIEAAADLADVIVSHSAGRVDVSTVRHEALRVACLAAQLWLVSLEQPVEDEAEHTHRHQHFSPNEYAALHTTAGGAYDHTHAHGHPHHDWHAFGDADGHPTGLHVPEQRVEHEAEEAGDA